MITKLATLVLLTIMLGLAGFYLFLVNQPGKLSQSIPNTTSNSINTTNIEPTKILNAQVQLPQDPEVAFQELGEMYYTNYPWLAALPLQVGSASARFNFQDEKIYVRGLSKITDEGALKNLLQELENLQIPNNIIQEIVYEK